MQRLSSAQWCKGSRPFEKKKKLKKTHQPVLSIQSRRLKAGGLHPWTDCGRAGVVSVPNLSPPYK